MSSLIIWLEATRPKTLPAALVPVLLASSLAYVEGHFDWLPTIICLLFALLVQVGTNLSMVKLAAAAEMWLGKPVIAINTATYWNALRQNGIMDQKEGFGRLMAEF